MLSIPSYILAIGAFIVWVGLMLSWTRHIYEISEQRRIKASAQGETAPDIKGVSNYERAELRESAHRAMQITPREKWIGRGLFFGVPAIIAAVFLTKLPL